MGAKTARTEPVTPAPSENDHKPVASIVAKYQTRRARRPTRRRRPATAAPAPQTPSAPTL